VDEALDESRALAGLIGETCEQIWFVQDYVMVITEGSSITCVTDPEIVIDGVTYRLPEPGSRDALCSLINKTVVGARQFETGACEIDFADGSMLRVSPWPESPTREFIYIADRAW
jgi:hypothetical protein